MPNKAWLGIALVLLVGCDEAHDNEVHDKGEVCLYADAAATTGRQQYVAGQALGVQVSLGECLSACIRNEVVSCAAVTEPAGEVGDAVITIESTFQYDDPDGADCILICKDLVANCATEPLAEGSYWVHHGSHQLYPLTIPSSHDAPVCF